MSAAILRGLRNIGGGPVLHNVMKQPGIFAVAIQMTSRFYGEAKNLMMAALASEYMHPKIVIAVDADVDIFNQSEVMWALATRVNPEKDVVVIPGTHNPPMDAALPELGATGTSQWQRFGSKMMIDATRPSGNFPPRHSLPADAIERARGLIEKDYS